MEILKVCTACHQAKPQEEFHKNRNTRDGLDYMCKACKREYNRQRRAKLWAMGFCKACGKRKADPGYTTCTRCRTRQAEAVAKHYVKKATEK